MQRRKYLTDITKVQYKKHTNRYTGAAYFRYC